MHDLGQAFIAACRLIAGFDPELIGIVALSLKVSLSATMIALMIGAPAGAALAVTRFRGRQAIVVVANALLGLPPVVVGLLLYLMLSRSGPLGAFGILFTPAAMVLAQTVLATPIVVALVHRATAALWGEYGDVLRVDRVPRRVRPRHRRGRRDPDRRRQHPRQHPHHDDGDRARDQQGRAVARARPRPDPDLAEHRRERRRVRAQSLGGEIVG